MGVKRTESRSLQPLLMMSCLPMSWFDYMQCKRVTRVAVAMAMRGASLLCPPMSGDRRKARGRSFGQLSEPNILLTKRGYGHIGMRKQKQSPYLGGPNF